MKTLIQTNRLHNSVVGRDRAFRDRLRKHHNQRIGVPPRVCGARRLCAGRGVTYIALATCVLTACNPSRAQTYDVDRENAATDYARLRSPDNTAPHTLPDLWDKGRGETRPDTRASTHSEKDNDKGVWLGSVPGDTVERSDDETSESLLDVEQGDTPLLVRASCSGSNGSNVEYTEAWVWVWTGISISCAPSGATVDRVEIHYNVDSNYIDDIHWYLENYTYWESPNYTMPVTGDDWLDGYDQTSEKTYSIYPDAGTPVNGNWYFNIEDTYDDSDADWNLGRIDSWDITVYYTIPPGAPGTPNLASDDDSGYSSSDDITRYTTSLSFSWSSASGTVDRYYYGWDDSTPTSNWTGSTSATVDAPSGNGNHTFCVRAWNSAAGYGPVSSLTVFIDRSHPSISNLDLRSSDDAGKYNNDNLTNDTNVRFTWTGSANGGSGIYRYWYGWDTNANDASTSNTYKDISPPSNDGTYTFYVGAQAVSGLWAYYPTYTDQETVTWDTTAPTPPTFDSPTEGALTTDTTPTLDWSQSNVWKWETRVREDQFPWTDDRSASDLSSSTWTVAPPLGYKPWSWQVKAWDIAGNEGCFGRNGDCSIAVIHEVWGHFTVLGPPTLVDADCYVTPSTTQPGGGVTFHYRIDNPNPSSLEVGFGASIRRNGTSTWTNDLGCDTYVTVPTGIHDYSRCFDNVPGDGCGSYDAAFGIWETIGEGTAQDGLEKLDEFEVRPNPCGAITPISDGAPQSGTLATCGAWASYTDCSWNEAGEERVYQFTTTVAGAYTLTGSATSGDADFYLLDTCSNAGTNILGQCWDGGAVSASLSADTTYYVVVDNYSAASTAEYTIRVDYPCESDIRIEPATVEIDACEEGANARSVGAVLNGRPPADERLFTERFRKLLLAPDPPNEDGCGTMLDYRAGRSAAGLEERGQVCREGHCDDPADRDAAIPTSNTPIKTFQVRFHVFGNNNGSNRVCTQNQIDTAVAQANADFLPWRVQFSASTRFVDDSTYRDLDSSEVTAMKNAYNEEPQTQLNVYVCNFVGNLAPWGGFGTFPWDGRSTGTQGGIYVNADSITSGHLLTHEIGHCVGLWHTFHGVDPGEVVACSDCFEQADGQDADTTGDLCSDTRPTPKNSNACTNPGGTDACSDTDWGETPYRNYMSYSSCRSEYTAQQAGRTHCWAEDVLSGWIGQTFAIFNDGCGPLNVSSIAKEDASCWLSVSPAPPYSIVTGESQMVAVHIDKSCVTPGVYSDRLLVHSDDPDEDPYPNGVYVNLTLNSSADPLVQASPGTMVCEGVAVTLDAGAGFSSYLWSPGGETTQTIEVTDGGTYGVTVTDANECGGSDSIVVAVNASPTPSIAATPGDTVCEGEPVTLDVGSGFNSYLWSPGAETTQTIEVTVGGTYGVAVTDANDCGGSDSIVVTVNASPTPTNATAEPGKICQGESAMLTGSVSGAVIEWYTGGCGDTFVVAGNAINVSPSATTTYYARSWDASTDCVSTACDTVVVTVNPLPSAPDDTTASPAVICRGSSTTLTALAGDSDIDWYTGGCGDTFVATGSSVDESPDATITYYSQARNPSNDCGSTQCGDVTVVVNESTPFDVDCSGIINLIDFSDFFECLSGPTGGPVDPICAVFDGNDSGSVDLHDFGLFQNAFTDG